MILGGSEGGFMKRLTGSIAILVIAGAVFAAGGASAGPLVSNPPRPRHCASGTTFHIPLEDGSTTSIYAYDLAAYGKWKCTPFPSSLGYAYLNPAVSPCKTYAPLGDKYTGSCYLASGKWRYRLALGNPDLGTVQVTADKRTKVLFDCHANHPCKVRFGYDPAYRWTFSVTGIPLG
jgi:hypothetical protein